MNGIILHLGRDSLHRVSTLQNAGFLISECRSVIQLGSILQADGHIDAVVLTEKFYSIPEVEIFEARSGSPVPFILFEEKDRSRPRILFDLVIPVDAPAVHWLGDIESLIARSRITRARSLELIAQSETLILEAKDIVQATRLQISSSRSQLAREIPKEVHDRGTIEIRKEKPASIHSASDFDGIDQLILGSLARLTLTLHRMIKAKLDGDSASDVMEELKVTHNLECATLESLLMQWKDRRRGLNKPPRHKQPGLSKRDWPGRGKPDR